MILEPPGSNCHQNNTAPLLPHVIFIVREKGWREREFDWLQLFYLTMSSMVPRLLLAEASSLLCLCLHTSWQFIMCKESFRSNSTRMGSGRTFFFTTISTHPSVWLSPLGQCQPWQSKDRETLFLKEPPASMETGPRGQMKSA